LTGDTLTCVSLGELHSFLG